MRIIGGNFRGKKIFIPKDKKTRPLKDLVKESIFNLILHSKKFDCSLDNSTVLDLFSGVGSFGLECISRNSKKVIFIENYILALDILKKNLNSFNINDKYEIIEKDCFNFFNSGHFFNEKFDIVFIDPPYKEKRTDVLINTILENQILKKDGIIIIHKHKKDESIANTKLKIIDQRNYGISKIIVGN